MIAFTLLLWAAGQPSAGLNLKYGGVALGIFFLGIALIRWSMKAYLESAGIQPVKGLRAPKMSAQFRMLQEMGMATGEQLSTMGATDRERLFAEAMIRRVAPNLSAAPPSEGEAMITSVLETRGPEKTALGLPTPGFRVSCARSYLFCPACGATLGDERTPIGFLTSCLTCKRVLKARLEGGRVTIEAAGG